MESSQASSSPTPEQLCSLFAHCNSSELYQIAREGGHVVLPSLPNDQLIRIIVGAEPAPPLHEHVVDSYRHAIMAFIIDHRKALETQIKCPARSFKPDACFGCLDQQVYSCLVANPDQQRLIQLYKRPPTQGDVPIMVDESREPLTVNTAPRNLAALAEQTPHTLRSLGFAIGHLKVDAPDTMVAWHRLPTSTSRAQIILDGLLAWDKEHPGEYSGPTLWVGPQPQSSLQNPPVQENHPPMNQPPQNFATQQPPQQFAPQPQQPTQPQYAPSPPPPQFQQQQQPYSQQSSQPPYTAPQQPAQQPQPQYQPQPPYAAPAPPQQQYQPPAQASQQAPQPPMPPQGQYFQQPSQPPPVNGVLVYGGQSAQPGAQPGQLGMFTPPQIVPPQPPQPSMAPQTPTEPVVDAPKTRAKRTPVAAAPDGDGGQLAAINQQLLTRLDRLESINVMLLSALVSLHCNQYAIQPAAALSSIMDAANSLKSYLAAQLPGKV